MSLDINAPLYRWNSSDLIGYGSFGRVYRGYDLNNTPVAVKILHSCDCDIPEYRREFDYNEFNREVDIISKIQHPNICQLLYVNKNPNYMVFEYCSQGNLYEVLYSKKMKGGLASKYIKLDLIKKKPEKYGFIELSFKERVSFSIDICRALVWLHQHYIFHQDIKPANILVTGDKRCKLCDFGTAKYSEDKNSISNPDLDGSPAYQAPEIFNGTKITEHSEVYAFAITMWEIFTQDISWKGHDNEDIHIFAINNGDRPPLSSSPDYPNVRIDSRVVNILEKSWNCEQMKRLLFSEILELLKELVEKE